MSAQYLTITAKHAQRGYTSLADFTVTSTEAVSPDIVCTNPSITLYCLDDATRQAIFVELPPDVDLAQAPFIYITQYEQAQRLIAVPYATFRQLARQLPQVKHLIMMYMTGRSGSTLLSQLFNELDTVRSLSEPDVATQFVRMRRDDPSRDSELQDLLDCTVRFLFKPSATKTPTTYALKLKSEATQLMELYQAAFPQAKNLFLYRDAVGFVQSLYRLWKRWQTPEVLPVREWLTTFCEINASDLTPLTAYIDEGTTELSMHQFLTLWWLASMEWYLAQHARGIPALAVRYDDLNRYREQVVTAVFRYCGLSTARIQETLVVFGRDSQAGTDLARENPDEGNRLRLSDEQRRDVLRILQRHPVVKEPDFVVPGTLRV